MDLIDQLSTLEQVLAIVAGLLILSGISLTAALLLGFRKQDTPASRSNTEPSEREEAIRYLLYNVAHEVSGPLQNMLIVLENMKRCTMENEARWHQSHQLVSDEVKRLARLTENAKLLAQLHTPDAPVTTNPVNVKALVEEVILSMADRAESKGVDLCYRGPSNPPWVLGDRDRLKQVIFNLVENGLKHAPEGSGNVVIKMNAAENQLCVSVSDNGPGIPPDRVESIWREAYTDRDASTLDVPGTGLGLAIVRRIVEQHRGTVSVHSVPGKIASFTFTIPLHGDKKP